MLTAPSAGAPAAGPLDLAEQERRAVLEALRQAKGNKVHAAKLLGVSRRALYRLIAHHGLEVNRPGAGAAPAERDEGG
jgi:DNA-binding NtrC family response regulator